MTDDTTAATSGEGQAVDPAPGPIARGLFALYPTPDGGYHCSVRVDGEDADRHIQIPGKLLKMAGMLGGRSPLAAVRAMLGGGGGA